MTSEVGTPKWSEGRLLTVQVTDARRSLLRAIAEARPSTLRASGRRPKRHCSAPMRLRAASPRKQSCLHGLWRTRAARACPTGPTPRRWSCVTVERERHGLPDAISAHAGRSSPDPRDRSSRSHA